MTDFNADRRYDFKVDLAHGQEAERELSEAFHACTIEVKRDDRAADTGNVYVEFEADKGATGRFEPSGIATTEADWQAFKVRDVFLLVPTDYMRTLARKAWVRRRIGEQRHGSCPTRGALVSLHELVHPAVQSECPFCPWPLADHAPFGDAA